MSSNERIWLATILKNVPSPLKYTLTDNSHIYRLPETFKIFDMTYSISAPSFMILS